MWTLQQRGFQSLTPSLLYSFTSIITFLSITSTAQFAASTGPAADSDYQWTIVDEKTLYVQGGEKSTALFSMDLTKNFTDTNPPWTSLAKGPGTWSECMVPSADKSQLVVLDTLNKVVATYTIATNKWTNGTALTDWPYQNHVAGALDPDTNTIYVVNGDHRAWPRAMIVYDITTGIIGSVKTPSIDPSLRNFASVWSTQRKSLLLYGGAYISATTDDTPSSTLLEYTPSTNTWTDLTSKLTGTGPGKLSNHCMVPAYNGTKMVVFGGWIPDVKDNGQIHFLDTTTLVWTAGTATSSVRANMVCAVAGDSFLAWGGSRNSLPVLPNTPIIYNMRTNQWVHQFDPVPYQAPVTTTTAAASLPTNTNNSIPNGNGNSNSNANTQPIDTTTPLSHGSSAGAIGGGIGAVVLLAAIGAFIFFRRKNSRQQQVPNDDNTKPKETEKVHETRVLRDNGRDRPFDQPTSAPLSSSFTPPLIPSPFNVNSSTTFSQPPLMPSSFNKNSSVANMATFSPQSPIITHPSNASSTISISEPTSVYVPPPQSWGSPDQPLSMGTDGSKREVSAPRSPHHDRILNFQSRGGGVTSSGDCRSPHSLKLERQKQGVFIVNPRGISPASFLAFTQSSPQTPSSPHEIVHQPFQPNTMRQPYPSRDSISTVVSSTSPSSRMPKIIDMKSDLAKRQLALIQVQQELDREKLRLAEELQMRQMGEAEEWTRI